ncbi:hypothetical protein GGI20_000160 [Coemansia sp. BCRC 34301]|nr:hypothetical protein GGI20_000160 [Coemansia sp. BCRC 34301]
MSRSTTSAKGCEGSFDGQTTVAATETGQALTNSTLLPEDSDSDVLDVMQILKTSDIVRRQLERNRYHGSSSSSSASDGDDAMDVDARMPGSTSPSADRANAPEPANAVGGVPHTELACDKELMAILAETESHYYPLRKRSEKNMHPYTKLVWTDPDALRAFNGKRRDLSILEEEEPIPDPSSNSHPQNNMRVDPDNSEDEEYIPGMIDDATNDTQNAEPVVDDLDKVVGGSLLPLVERRIGLTYRHLAARRRQRLGRPPRKRPRGYRHMVDAFGHRRQHQQQENGHLPSISSVLGLRHGDSDESSDDSTDDASDPFGIPQFGDIHAKSTPAAAARYTRMTNEGDVAHSSIDSPQSKRHRPLFGMCEISGDDADASSTNSILEPKRHRRLLPRRSCHLVDTDNQTQSGLESKVDLPTEALPTSRARMLSKLSRNQMRGILPFSFMRDLRRDKNQAIQEEVDRWKQSSGSRGASKRRVLPSSPSESSSGPDNDQTRLGFSSAHAQAANDVSDLFSDLAIPSPRADCAALTTHCPRFAFNFIDIYEWQYPPLAPEGSVDRAPDFLRIAAREARRQGVRAKSFPDDPSKKAIYICSRCVPEPEDEDVAQSILLSWSLGMIDLRRVYFSTEYDDSDSECSMPTGSFVRDWPVDDDSLAVGASDIHPASIILSDDSSEAVEDNTVSIMSLGRSRSSYTDRTRQGGSRAKRQGNLVQSRMPNYRSSRRAPAYSHRQGARGPPAALKLASVMSEFAALDSDSDGSQSISGVGAIGRPDNQPIPVDNKSRSTEASRQRFINKFRRLPLLTKSSSNRHGSTAQPRRTSLHSADSPPQSPAQAEFLFDDDQTRSVSRWHQTPPKRQQTRFLSSRPAPSHASAPAADSKSTGSRLDSAAVHIGKLQQKPAPSLRKAATQRRSRKSAPVRNARHVALPTRVQVRDDVYSSSRIAATTGWAARRIQGSDDVPEDDMSNDRLVAALTDSQSGPYTLPSGARFDNGMWISQGGICRVQQMLFRAYRSGVDRQDSALEKQQHGVDGGLNCTYQYLDILRIDISATPAEFVQAYSTLFILWYEILGGSAELQSIGSANDTVSSVFRWTEYSQYYIVSKAGFKADLSQLAQRLTDCAHDSLSRLNQLVDRRNLSVELGASIALSFLVSLLQLALVFDGLLSVQGNLGPHAVGEEDELDSQWSADRFKTEIDNCLKGAVRLLVLGDLLRHQKLRRLGPIEQTWAALIHLFPGRNIGAASSNHLTRGWSPMDVVPVADVWSTALQVCSSSASSDRELAASIWSTIIYLLPLTQLNAEGIAAPHSDRRCHKALLQLVESATEKQLFGAERGAGDGRVMRLPPTEELTIRQTFFRIHGIVVDEGVGVGPSSPLYTTLYRFLETRGFCSLSIEPPPSLPRFFTRYGGTLDRESGPADTCTMLWLKALDKSLGEWTAQLKALPAASKEHRRALRDVRSTVSKLLPTRILTFDGSAASTHLSTLANYYSVCIFFLHAIPSDVVRSARLYSQLQSMLRFKESSSLTARRVYFEAWSAATTIIALNLKGWLEGCGSGATRVVELLIASDTAAVPADVKDYYGALMMAVDGWSESLGIVVSESSASSQRPVGGDMAPAIALWRLADSALMYLTRVLTSAAVTDHAPTVLLLVLAALKTPAVLGLVTSSEAIALPAIHAPLLKRLLTVLGTWQRAVAATEQPGNGAPVADSTDCNGDVVAVGGGEDSQMDFAMFDSMDLLDIAAEAAELERRAPFAAIDLAILQLIHEQYIPGIRLLVVQQFSALSSSSIATPSGQRHQMRALELTVGILAHMVSACVDASLRTWESFLDEHGRDTLYLIPDSHGRRLVLVQFAVAAIGVARAKGQQMERLGVLLKDVWFASVCDLRLIAYVEQLAALLLWADEKLVAAEVGVADHDYCQSPAVFVGALPVLRQRQLIVQSQGTLRDSVIDGCVAVDASREWHQNAAPLALSLIGRVLTNMAARVGQRGAGMYKQVFASWVACLLGTQQKVQAESRRRMHGVNDTRKLVDMMAERVAILVRDNCADLRLPPDPT